MIDEILKTDTGEYWAEIGPKDTLVLMTGNSDNPATWRHAILKGANFTDAFHWFSSPGGNYSSATRSEFDAVLGRYRATHGAEKLYDGWPTDSQAGEPLPEQGHGFNIRLTGPTAGDPEVLALLGQLIFMIAEKEGKVPEVLRQMMEWPAITAEQRANFQGILDELEARVKPSAL